jgi:endonuclease/exonuclease/phosphatase family metal-dependent hydrolase
MFRLLQVRAIDERVAELVPQTRQSFPPILMGDFNAHPATDEIRYLSGELVQEGKSVYWADAWTYAGDGPGYTFDRRHNAFAALCHEPPRRIDYIFVRGPDAEFRGEPLTTRLAFCDSVPGASGTVWPSDHFGLHTELAARPRSA